MKYLKTFEELSPEIYKRAAVGFRKRDEKDRSQRKKLGMSDEYEEDFLLDKDGNLVKDEKGNFIRKADASAKNLEDHAKEREGKYDVIKWKKNLQTYSPFGIFKLNIANPKNGKKLTGDFALDFDYEFEKEGNLDNINFFLGLIPTSEDLIKKCEEVMPSPEMNNGFYWGMCCSIDFKVKNGEVIFDKFKLEDYDDNLSGNVSFADRPSADKFKMVLKNLFSNPGYGYPSSRTDCKDQWEALERTILNECGLSSEYGFELEQVASFINTISPNTLYKAI